ncbi:MAG TPA: hypothetical protein V6D29_03985 [Leptolyngbyaceae cyanobacterium]
MENLILLTGLISSGLLIWFIVNQTLENFKKVRKNLSSNSLKEKFLAALDAIGMQRRREARVEEFVEQLTEVTESLSQFSEQYARPEQIYSALESLPLYQARQISDRVWELRADLFRALSKTNASIVYAMKRANVMLDLGDMAKDHGGPDPDFLNSKQGPLSGVFSQNQKDNTPASEKTVNVAQVSVQGVNLDEKTEYCIIQKDSSGWTNPFSIPGEPLIGMIKGGKQIGKDIYIWGPKDLIGTMFGNGGGGSGGSGRWM